METGISSIWQVIVAIGIPLLAAVTGYLSKQVISNGRDIVKIQTMLEHIEGLGLFQRVISQNENIVRLLERGVVSKEAESRGVDVREEVVAMRGELRQIQVAITGLQASLAGKRDVNNDR